MAEGWTVVVLAAVYLATTSVGFYILYCIEAAPKQIECECETQVAMWAYTFRVSFLWV